MKIKAISQNMKRQNCVVAKTLVFEMSSGVESSFALAGCVNCSKYAHSSKLWFPHLVSIMVSILQSSIALNEYEQTSFYQSELYAK